jgi:dipeptidyl aminopeptidase/acylaminoacyl peptidase
MLIANYDNPGGLIVIDPDNQARCDVLLEPAPFGRIMTAAGNIYYPAFDPDAQTVTIWQLSSTGEQAPLTFTTVDMAQFGPFSFALSSDGTKIAWARTDINFEVEPPLYRNDLWVANIDGSEQVTLVDQVENTEKRYLEPVQFSPDNSKLSYALQPDGLDGSIEISGRYDNIYSISVAGDQPQLIFACPTAETPICIGDLAPDGNTLVYTDPEAAEVRVISRDGNLINALTPPATDYIGPAIFGPAGKLAFVSATHSQTTSDDLPLPSPGHISLIEPPYSGQPRILLSDNSVATVWEWLDESRLAYGSIDEFGNVGTTIVTIDGQVTELSRNYALAVLR